MFSEINESKTTVLLYKDKPNETQDIVSKQFMKYKNEEKSHTFMQLFKEQFYAKFLHDIAPTETKAIMAQQIIIDFFNQGFNKYETL